MSKAARLSTVKLKRMREVTLLTVVVDSLLALVCSLLAASLQARLLGATRASDPFNIVSTTASTQDIQCADVTSGSQ